jgi:A/G-specific adenine glycosylase
VLVSEVMLQQTQVSRVIPAYVSFIDRFPTPAALAAAPLAEVLRAWRGLGYNRRAAALWRAAGILVAEHAGMVPRDPVALAGLAGIGPYTAAAVASLGHGVAVPAVDVNVRRVVARACLGLDPREAGAAEIRAAAAAWLDPEDPGAWNQALMDLGREVCRAEPACGGCPLRQICRFRGSTGRGSPGGRRRPEPFAGSFRQVRGRVIDVLRDAPELTLAELSRRCGLPPERVASAVAALAAEGLLRAGPGALAGRPRGRVRLGA